MWDDITFNEWCRFVCSIRDGKKADWSTGEGICWEYCAKEELEVMQSLELKWQECE